MTIETLIAVLRQVAGDDDSIDLSVVNDDESSFSDIGFDSIALFEVLNILKRDYGVLLGDDVLEHAQTPSALLGVIQKEDQNVA